MGLPYDLLCSLVLWNVEVCDNKKVVNFRKWIVMNVHFQSSCFVNFCLWYYYCRLSIWCSLRNP